MDQDRAPRAGQRDAVATRTRSYARVARSSSTDSFEEKASARRWSVAETKQRIEAAPEFRFHSPPRPLLEILVAEYEALTGDLIRTFPKRNLLAACYRVHGPDTMGFIADEFARACTAVNLLGIVRTATPRQVVEAPVHSGPHRAPPCPVDQCLPHLIYCVEHRPAFDPTSTRRYDRRPSNPDAAAYFATEAAA